jgi:hypothetical protein
MGHVVPQENGMFQSERPEGHIEGFRPMKELMKHARTSKIEDASEHSLNIPILKVSSNTAELQVNGLTRAFSKMVLEFLGIERKVVSVELLELDSILQSLTLKLTQGPHSVPSSEGGLIPDEHIARGMIDGNGATHMAGLGRFLSKSVEKTATSGRFILI